jgi:hypothetical protein
LTSFVSFYTLPNKILGNKQHDSLKAAFLWFYATEDENKIAALVSDALISAKEVSKVAIVLQCMMYHCLQSHLSGLTVSPATMSLIVSS